jgi:Mce-associated membrane protein
VTVGDESPTNEVPKSDVKAAIQRRIGFQRNKFRQHTARWHSIVLTLLVVAATGLAVQLFVVDYHPDEQTDKASAREVIRAASDGTVALLSYSPDTLSRDFANAKKHLTDDFQDYYKRFTEQIVAPTAQRGLTTETRVIRAAVSELHPTSAVVLVFINQQTASPDKPQPATTGSSVRVSLRKVNGSWLIANFDAL